MSVSVQRYSVQYKGYNLIRVTTVEGGATRGTTALVVDSYLYIPANIQELYRVTGVHPTGLTVTRGVGRCPHFIFINLFQSSPAAAPTTIFNLCKGIQNSCK